MGKNKRFTKLTAGPLVYAVCYTQVRASDPDRARAAKTRISTQARQSLNRRLSWQKLELLLACNFGPGDLWVTLTYDDEHIPRSRHDACQRLKRYLRTLSSVRRARGEELRYVKNVESVTKKGQPTRLHHHLVINGTGKDFEELRALWPYGSDIDIQLFRSGGETYEDVARYMSKEAPPNSQNSWTPSRNLSRPVRESYLVDDGVTLSTPVGAHELDKQSCENQFGSYSFLKYVVT